MTELVRVEGLSTHYLSEGQTVRAVDNVSLTIRRGEAVALVGESGSGKSTTAFSIMRLISKPGRIVGGRVLLDGRDILTLDAAAMARLRGVEMSMVFQEPMTFLNPLIRVGEQVAESIRIHQDIKRSEVRRKVIETLAMVQLPNPETVADYYPHQLSGGMRQRALIAVAIACRPSLLIADEPTTARSMSRFRRRSWNCCANSAASSAPRAPAHHAQSRPGGRVLRTRLCHVCRPDRRGSRHLRPLRVSPASLHGGASRLFAPLRPSRRPVPDHTRPPPEPRRSAPGVPVPSPLFPGDGRMLKDRTRRGPLCQRQPGPLPPARVTGSDESSP